MTIKRLHIFHNDLPELLSYVDYRQYLFDLFNSLKKSNRGFSYRVFSQLAGSSSPNFLQLILKNKISMQNSQITALAKSINLKNYEEHYLENLVSFDKAQDHEEKEKYYKRIIQIRGQKNIHQLEAHQYDYFNEWYHAAVRELVVSPDYPGDPSWIADRLETAVSPGKVEKSIELLSQLHLIERIPDTGMWTQTDIAISTPSVVPGIAVRRYHKEMSDLAGKSLNNLENLDGNYYAVTCGVDDEGLKVIRKKCEDFWNELLEFTKTQKNVKHVYQANIHLFPLTKKVEKENE
jgi:uncharacterized protein (TIGR02147 family)